jgi:hypothetical protein
MPFASGSEHSKIRLLNTRSSLEIKFQEMITFSPFTQRILTRGGKGRKAGTFVRDMFQLP